MNMAGKGVQVKMPQSRRAIGIDLGTTYSVVAVSRSGRVEMLANESGSRTTPSVVAFMDGTSYVGDAAKDHPHNSQVFDAKRLIGRSFLDRDVQADCKHWPFQVVNENGAPKISLTVESGKRKVKFAPEEISAMVLRYLKQLAEGFLHETVTKAVITVPAYFNERQRQATVDAARIAELEVLSIINEPTAAAIAYGLDKKSASKRTVFIFDLGGGTFDVSVMSVEGVEFNVIATSGDTHLGGQDFDVRLMEHLISDIRAKHGVELDPQSRQELRRECELTKRRLSTLAEVKVSVFFPRIPLGYKTTVSRALFEDLCADLFKKAMALSAQTLADAKVSVSAIDEVVLVGGSTRIPKVRSMLRDLFGGKELRHSINPDEAVAYGAAVHAAVLTGDKFCENLVKLKDVTPLSLGISTLGDRFSSVIPKNTPIPCRNTQVYSNSSSAPVCSIRVFQGERALIKDNFDLNKKFDIKIPSKPPGQVKMDVTFELDVDGLLVVSCVEKSTGERKHITISSEEAKLSDKDIKEMIDKAEKFRSQDEREKRLIEQELRMKGHSI